MSEWPGSGWGADPDSHDRRPGPAREMLAALATLIVLGLDALVLPWIYWGFGSGGDSQVVNEFSLWTLFHGGQASDLGVGWLIPIAYGMGVALIGTLAELVFRPTHPWPRWLSVGGFAVALLGACVGLIVGSSSSGDLSGVFSNPMTTGLDAGFWIGLVGAGFGTAMSAIHLLAPPNETQKPPPFRRSPWGRPAPVAPPGFIPPQPDAWVDYIRRGEVPPGYVPPSYGPAVYPTPGFMTPAYIAPGYRGNAASPFAGSDDVGEPPPDVVVAQMRARGRVVVADGPHVSTLLVEPGRRLLVGRDSEAEIRVTDHSVSERHAAIERRGLGWAVQDIDAFKATRLVDAWGAQSLIRGEVEIPAGQLQVGNVVVTMFPVQPEKPEPPPAEDGDSALAAGSDGESSGGKSG